MIDCTYLKTLSNSQLWAYVEGDTSIKDCVEIKNHLLGCDSCLNEFAEVFHSLSAEDPVRYNISKIETLNSQKAKLLRNAETEEEKQEIYNIKNSTDFFRVVIGRMLGEVKTDFHRVWDSATDQDRTEIIIRFLKEVQNIGNDSDTMPDFEN